MNFITRILQARPCASKIVLPLGLLAVACNPGIGTVLCWILHIDGVESRRIAQFAVLLAGLAAVWRTRAHWINPERAPRQASIFALSLAAFCAYLAFLYFQNGKPEITSASMMAGFIASLFFAQSIVLLVEKPKQWLLLHRLPHTDDGHESQDDGLRLFSIYANIIGWALAIMVWYRGPAHTDGSIHLAMNGMPIMLGVLFASVYLVLIWRARPLRIVWATPWLYLALCTTSRLIVVLFALVIAGSLLDALVRWMRALPFKRLLAGQLVFVCVLITLFTLPVFWPSCSQYPYRNSAEPTSSTEWCARWGRMLRVLALGAQPQTDKPTHWETALFSGGIAEDRFELSERGIDAAVATPLGTWPDTMRVSTSVEVAPGATQVTEYRYPHNFFVEYFGSFGFVTTAIVIGGLALVTCSAFYGIARFGRPADLFAGVLFVAELIRIQVSGDMNDAAGFCVIFIFIANRSLLKPTTTPLT